MKTRFVLLVAVFTFCISCSTLKFHSELTEVEKKAQVSELTSAQQELDHRNFTLSLARYREFKKNHIGSPFYFSAQLGEAKSLEGLGQWAEATGILRQSVEATRQHQPELAALSVYELSYCYEAVGDEIKSLASLLDAKNLSKYLPAEIQKAEIPARLAASYHRMGRAAEAQQYLHQAEAGLIELKTAQTMSNEATARTYFQMGLLSTRQVSLENFKAVTSTLRIVQVFSLHAMELNDAKWSSLAAETLLGTYKDLKKNIMEVPLRHAMDPGVALREQRALQAEMSGDLLLVLQELKSLRLVKEDEPPTVGVFFVDLEAVEKELNEMIVKDPIKNELSKESSRWNQLKREGRVKSKPLFKEEVQGVDKK